VYGKELQTNERKKPELCFFFANNAVPVRLDRMLELQLGRQLAMVRIKCQSTRSSPPRLNFSQLPICNTLILSRPQPARVHAPPDAPARTQRAIRMSHARAASGALMGSSQAPSGRGSAIVSTGVEADDRAATRASPRLPFGPPCQETDQARESWAATELRAHETSSHSTRRNNPQGQGKKLGPEPRASSFNTTRVWGDATRGWHEARHLEQCCSGAFECLLC
jgi:hypothetical protein